VVGQDYGESGQFVLEDLATVGDWRDTVQVGYDQSSAIFYVYIFVLHGGRQQQPGSTPE
jgi:hypothetical protein